jgi:hypothetical protein
LLLNPLVSHYKNGALFILFTCLFSNEAGLEGSLILGDGDSVSMIDDYPYLNPDFSMVKVGLRMPTKKSEF